MGVAKSRAAVKTNKKISKAKSPLKSADLPATQGMLSLVRNELKADVRGLRSEMKSGFKLVDARFNQVDARFDQVDARFAQMDSKMEQMMSDICRTHLLIEEQNSRNRVVLEGLSGLCHRQDRVEMTVTEMENLMRRLGAEARAAQR